MSARRRTQAEVVRRLAEVIRRVRLNAGISQREMALRAGTTASRWGQLENLRQKDIGLILFARIAISLGLTATQLMSLIENGRRETKPPA